MAKVRSKKNPHEEAIRELYELGDRVVQTDEHVGVKGDGGRHWGSIEQVSEETGISKSYLHVARLFRQQYSKRKELLWLLRLGTSEGKPLSRSHVRRLTAVVDREERDRLAEQCAKEGWSVIRLTQEIQALKGKRPYGGRRPQRPADRIEALAQLNRMTGGWLRWYDAMQADGDVDGVTMRDLPRQLAWQLRTTSEQVERLREEVRAQLRKGRLKPLAEEGR